MSTGELLGIGLASGAVNALGGNMMMENQQQNQMQLNNQALENSKEMWDYTNFENQRKHLENAGLNVGLMYGKGGGGGATTSGQSGGSATSGESMKVDSNVMGIGLQNQVQSSQIELNKALANKANTEAGKTGGVDTVNAQIEAEIKRIDLATKEGTFNDVLRKIQMEANNLDAQWAGKLMDNTVNKETQQTQISTAKANLAGIMLNNSLTKVKTELTSVQIDEVKQNITNSIQNVLTNKRNASTNELRMLNDQMQQEIQRELQRAGLSLDEQKMYMQTLSNIIGAGIGGMPSTTRTYTDGNGQNGDYSNKTTTIRE